MWRTAIEVPVGAELEYKLVHLPAAAEAPRWEEAENHTFKTTLEARAAAPWCLCAFHDAGSLQSGQSPIRHSGLEARRLCCHILSHGMSPELEGGRIGLRLSGLISRCGAKDLGKPADSVFVRRRTFRCLPRWLAWRCRRPGTTGAACPAP